jgi:hypothetical protein
MIEKIDAKIREKEAELERMNEALNDLMATTIQMIPRLMAGKSL